ncbi:capsid cement protein [Mycobacterium paragordonae]|uniref:DUF2190 family protein n=1 Tax=Mycobacterium paragordonae TaxID=1389713 RepID=A0A4R5WIB7_9MYCO|nr:capsid cement protein [Mycobacterium paragordonae]MDP7738991.1 DUF2190 family protein [Mycobacterium paragordonae]TDK90282.1 DUF2190 family protein [Mycobacterium paragordonae]TDL03099.1 DUF2190 family protein [Mycobacterium paragordonae]
MSVVLTNVRVYKPGADVTAEVSTGAVAVKTFVKIGGNRTSGGNLAVVQAAAGDRAFGVAAHDAATGQLVHVARGGVVKVVAAGTISAGAEVQVGAAGAVAAKSSGVAIGYAVNGAADGADAEIALY